MSSLSYYNTPAVYSEYLRASYERLPVTRAIPSHMKVVLIVLLLKKFDAGRVPGTR